MITDTYHHNNNACWVISYPMLLIRVVVSRCFPRLGLKGYTMSSSPQMGLLSLSVSNVRKRIRNGNGNGNGNGKGENTRFCNKEHEYNMYTCTKLKKVLYLGGFGVFSKGSSAISRLRDGDGDGESVPWGLLCCLHQVKSRVSRSRSGIVLEYNWVPCLVSSRFHSMLF